MEPSIHNFKIIVEYDGSAYHGWQRQKELCSVQEEIESALQKMSGQQVSLIGSGRTDAGVHAMGQTANFRCLTRITAPAFEKGLNSLLPDDVVIRSCLEVDEAFHARYDVASKLYRYCILNRETPSAVGRQYAWFIRRPLAVDHMQQATCEIMGRHDFKAFEGTGSPRSHTIRNIIQANWRKAGPDLLVFDIEANGFLRFMVRNLVGSLVDVGLGKKSVDDFRTILASRDRSLGGATAPPHGLFLVLVKY